MNSSPKAIQLMFLRVCCVRRCDFVPLTLVYCFEIDICVGRFVLFHQLHLLREEAEAGRFPDPGPTEPNSSAQLTALPHPRLSAASLARVTRASRDLRRGISAVENSLHRQLLLQTFSTRV
jgi:hypothetical protein